MVTREFKVHGFDTPVLVHRQKDWSGLIVIEWTDAQSQQHHVVEIPARVILSISFQETKAWMLGEIARVLVKMQGES